MALGRDAIDRVYQGDEAEMPLITIERDEYGKDFDYKCVIANADRMS